MADRIRSHDDNAPGSFYVDERCIDCDMCLATASQNFERNQERRYSYIAKQPENEDEWALCLQAMEGCPVSAIGYDKDAAFTIKMAGSVG